MVMEMRQAAGRNLPACAESVTHTILSSNLKKQGILAFPDFSPSPALAKLRPAIHFPPSHCILAESKNRTHFTDHARDYRKRTPG
jgi:hypothetical protein